MERFLLTFDARSSISLVVTTSFFAKHYLQDIDSGFELESEKFPALVNLKPS
jgi:hypothetical protein